MQRGLQYAAKNPVKTTVWAEFDFSAKAMAGLVVVLLAAIVPLFIKDRRYRTGQQILNVAVLGFWCGSFLNYTSIISYMSNGMNIVALIVPVIMLITAFVYPLFGKKSYYSFTFFQNGLILAAGDKDSYNAMTIWWGSMGTIWGRNLPLMTVYVAQKRYTHEFMEKSKYFTVMQFSDTDVIQYMGKHSGRDCDKAKALSLHVAYTENGTPYFKEADVVIECEIMYSAPFEEKNFRNDVPKIMS